ncbi:MAG: hypothetical protein ACRDST_06120, partial [Pseudonocardiaceae bacterium]
MAPPPDTAPAEEVIDCLVDGGARCCGAGALVGVPPRPSAGGSASSTRRDRPGASEFEALERVGAWERMIAWAQARQAREMTWFVDSATARNRAVGACDSQAHESAVAEVGLMLTTSARTAAGRGGQAWSLCTRLPRPRRPRWKPAGSPCA